VYEASVYVSNAAAEKRENDNYASLATTSTENPHVYSQIDANSGTLPPPGEEYETITERESEGSFRAHGLN